MAKGEYGWLIGAGLGFVTFGPLGAIIGGIIGAKVGSKKKQIPFNNSSSSSTRNKEHYTGGGQEGDLIVSFLVLAAAITKADSKIMSSEIKVLKEFVVRSFGAAKGAALMNMYKEILEKDIDVDSVCSQIRNEADSVFKRTIVQILFEIAAADNDLAKVELNLITKIAVEIGLSTTEYNSIASMYNAGSSSSSSNSSASSSNRDYDILEITSSATDSELKAKYRELVKKYHPDKVSHLGEEFKSLAEKKFKEINNAYSRLKEERGM